MSNRKIIQSVRIKQRAHRAHSTRIVFVGAGNLGGAVIKSLVAKRIYAKREIFVITSSETSAKRWRRWGVQAAPQNYAVLSQAKEVWLAVKPHQIRELAVSMAPYLQNAKGVQVVSLLAGWTPSSLQKLLNHRQVISLMTNTAARINAGLFAIFYSDRATQLVAKKYLTKIKKMGFGCGVFSEQQMPEITALVGSAPAFLLHLQSQYQTYAVERGLLPKQAKGWFSALMLSCERLAIGVDDFGELMSQIATPGGCTERGLLVLGKDHSLHGALVSCADRAKELGA